MTFKKTSLLTFLALGLCCSTSLLAMDPPLLSEEEYHIGVEGAKAIAGAKNFTSLQNLSLSNNTISRETDETIIGHLKSFNLNDQEVQKIWEDFGELMPSRGPLKPLALASKDPLFLALGLWRAHQEREMLPADQAPLNFTSFLSCLLTKEFSSKHTKISRLDAQLFTTLIRFNPYFTTLEFFKAGISDNHLIQMGIIPHLQELSLEENELTDARLDILLKYPKLQKLSLAKNKITAKGAALLAKSPTLLHLNLYKTLVGDEGAESLSWNTVLTYLDLRETGVGDPGAIALAKNNKTLTELRLRFNKITNAGAESFLNSHHLTHLELARNQIADELVYILEHLMPSNGFLNILQNPKAFSSSFLLSQKERVRILSIDGGGIRGILPGGLLKYIEDALTQKTGSQFYFAKHVDLMAGTSTGGIISLGLVMPGERGRPKYTTQTLLDLYTTKGEEIFPGPWLGLPGIFTATYPPKGIEKYLSQYFEDVYISESVCPTLITSFDLTNNQAHVFDSEEAKRNAQKNFHLKGAGRATSAAPTYFPAAKIKNKLQEEYDFVDGGIYANNPTLLALRRAQQLYPMAREYVVYSFGTGQAAKKNLVSLGNAGLGRWGVNIPNVLMDNAAEYTEKLLKAEISKDSRIKYVRIQPQIQNSEKEMDNVSLENIDDLLETVQETIIKEKATLDKIIEDFLKDFQKK